MKKLAIIFGALLFLGNGVVAQQLIPETETLYLSGKGSDDKVEWEFFCTEGRNSGKWTTIKVPSCWEQEGFGRYTHGLNFTNEQAADSAPSEQGKYKYKFDVPAEWESKKIRLVFEGVMTDTEIRLNGQIAGDIHQGGLYRFSYDVTNIIRVGKDNLLEVTVSKKSTNENINLVERKIPNWTFGGIFRPVFLEATPQTCIERVAINAQADGTFIAEISLGHAIESGFSIDAKITDALGEELAKTIQVEVPKGSDKVTIYSTTLQNIKLWSAETPNLYNVSFVLRDGEIIHHKTSQKFGFRTFEVHKSDGFYLNGQRIVLRGVNRNGFCPETGLTLSRERNIADIKLIKEMNANAVRLVDYSADQEFLEACDSIGLYVLNGFAGSSNKYDDVIGRKLIGDFVRRDVNHPSVLFWCNGSDGGWNTNLDNEFAQWDIQKRPVLHPQQLFRGVETKQNLSYGEMQECFRGDYIFMPTKFLPGLYDGGNGAGLYDYWEMMREHPRAGGGFLSAFADQGISRTDQKGRIDNNGIHGSNGIVGPRHEKEGSFNTIRQVWSPVQVLNETVDRNFRGTIMLDNRYDFINLNQCKIIWKLANFPKPEEVSTEYKIVAKGEMSAPNIEPHTQGEARLLLPDSWRSADVLYVTVYNPQGEELWTWSYTWKDKVKYFDGYVSKEPTGKEKEKNPRVRSRKHTISVSAGITDLVFDKSNGELVSIKQRGKLFSLKGIQFIAARRADRTLDGSINPKTSSGADLIYNEVKAESKKTAFNARMEGNDVLVDIKYTGVLSRVIWRINPEGNIHIDYEYNYDGIVELMGVKFDYPQSKVKSMRLLAKGPYRAWQNRLHGTTIDVWKNDYNDPTPGETFGYPEFKGYYNDWYWAVFNTTDGDIMLGNESEGSYLGVYTPKDGREELLYRLPETGIAVLDVIPAVRNQVNSTDLIGPSSQAQRVGGLRSGRVHLRLTPKK
ncbi:MAG: glycoside hydrolase family 2 TIM barrel-domain containing protein [Bacteroidales bacterium]